MLPARPSGSSLRLHATWVVGCRCLGIAATLAGNIVAARVLGPAEFGVFLVITAVMAAGSVLAMGGLNEAALRFIAESLALGQPAVARAYLRRVLALLAVTSLGAALVGALVAASGTRWWIERASQLHLPMWLAAIVAVGIVALAWQQVAAEALRACGAVKLASIFSGGQAGGPISNVLFVGALAGFALAYRPDAIHAAGLAAACALVASVLAVIGLWWISRRPRNDDDPAAIELTANQSRTLAAVAGTLLLNQLLIFASQQLDIGLGALLLDRESLGLYGAAKRSVLIAAMPVQMAALSVLAAIPRLHAQRQTLALERLLRRAATWAAIPALLALVALVVFPESILRMAFGNSYIGAATTVLVLALGYLGLIISGNPAHLLILTGRHRAVVAVNVAAAIVTALVGGSGALLFGAAGLAAGPAAGLILQNGLLWWLARRHLGISAHIGVWSSAACEPPPAPAPVFPQ
jgi:O-antigen/teichoic acid export membrane protein